MSKEQKILVFTSREIERLELDSEDDFRDEIASRIKTEHFLEINAGWDYSGKYYAVTVIV